MAATICGGAGGICVDFCVWAWYFNGDSIMSDTNKIIFEDGSLAVRLTKIEQRLDRLERVDRGALERQTIRDSNGYTSKNERRHPRQDSKIDKK